MMSRLFRKRRWPTPTPDWLPLERAILSEVVNRCDSPRLREALRNQVELVIEIMRRDVPGGYECIWSTEASSASLRMIGRWTVVNVAFECDDDDGVALIESDDGLIAIARFWLSDPKLLYSTNVRVQSVLYAKHFEDPPPKLDGWVAAAAAEGILVDFMPALDKRTVTKLVKGCPGLPEDYIRFVQQSDGCGIANTERGEILGLRNAVHMGGEGGEQYRVLIRFGDFDMICVDPGQPGAPLVYVSDADPDGVPLKHGFEHVVRLIHEQKFSPWE